MNTHVITNITRPPAYLIEAIRAYESATVHEASGGRGALCSGIKPIDPESVVCGPAVTVACRPGDNLILHKAIYVANPGDVLVASTGGYTEAGPWGEIMTVAAQVRGIAGLVTDGSVRDSRAIKGLQFPVFCKSLCIKGTTKHCPGTINHPINMGGVMIKPGDLILGDADGVVVVAREDLARVEAACKVRREKEEVVMGELRAGKSTLELYGFDRVLQAMGVEES